LLPNAIVELAQARSPAGTRFGTEALAAGKNGVSATVARKAMARSGSGVRAKARAAKQAAPSRSDMIIRRRRSMRSPREPPSGMSSPCVPNVTNSPAETHRADPVRSNRTKSKAVKAASVPVREIRRARAIRRAADREGAFTARVPIRRPKGLSHRRRRSARDERRRRRGT
jgi:hypothetical protein